MFCGVISQSDLVSALELGLMNKIPVGQVLADSGHVSAAVLDAALEVQNLMAELNMSITDARTVICAVKDGATVEDALKQLEAVETEDSPAEPEKPFLSLFDFLKTLGRTDDEQANEAFQMAKHNTDVLSQVLLISGSLGAETIERAKGSRKLVQDNKLNLERANIVFDYAERFNVDVTQALKDLQWYVPDKEEEEAAAAEAAAHKKAAEEQKKAASSSTKLAIVGQSTEGGTDAPEITEYDWETLQKKVTHLTSLGKTDKALESGLQLLQLAEKHLPAKLIESHDIVAALYIQRHNLDEAQRHYQISLDLRKSATEPQPGLLADGYANIGKVCYFKKIMMQPKNTPANLLKWWQEKWAKSIPTSPAAGKI